MYRSSILLLFLSIPVAQGYVTSYSAVPANKQVEWLKKLTGDICESPTGELTDEMIKSAPEIMKGWTSSKAGTENAVAVEALVKRLVEESKAGNMAAIPHTFEYNAMLESWARSGSGVFGAERCEQILTQMEERYQSGDSNVQPNLASFKTVLMAWRESGESYSSYRAQRVLDWMIRLHSEGKNDLVLPDSDCFDIVLQSWSHNLAPEAPSNAEKLLGGMEKLSRERGSTILAPRTVSFNAVLGAWSRSKDKLAWKRACSILDFMENLYYVEGNKRVKPDAATYSIFMSALARSGDDASAPQADAVLRRVEKEHKAGTLAFQPTTILFNSAMGCWSKSNAQGAYRRARSILDRQLNLYQAGCDECRPDVFGFTSVLSSCASESGEKKDRASAFNVALATFQELDSRSEEFGAPNHVSYGTMLKACVRLLPSGSPLRKKWTKKLFQECKARGLVGDMVLSRLREAASPVEYKELMEGNSKGEVPKSWKRNVNEKNQYRRKVGANRKRAEV